MIAQGQRYCVTPSVVCEWDVSISGFDLHGSNIDSDQTIYLYFVWKYHYPKLDFNNFLFLIFNPIFIPFKQMITFHILCIVKFKDPQVTKGLNSSSEGQSICSSRLYNALLYNIRLLYIILHLAIAVLINKAVQIPYLFQVSFH